MNHLARLARSLRSPHGAPSVIVPPTVPADARQASVLILLTDEADPRITLTERAAGLRDHAGQVSFPGGAVEADDATPIATALRESSEEVGLASTEVSVLGTLRRAWVPVSGFAVTPVVATWAGHRRLDSADPREVAAVHSIEMSTLADPANRVSSRHWSGHVGPAFVVGDLFIWGFTAHLLSWVLDLGEWSVSWDASHEVDVPARFERDVRTD